MRNKMPRLIDDRRRIHMVEFGAGVALLLLAVWCGYGAYMAPYEQRKKILRELIRDGQSVLDRFDNVQDSGEPGKLSNTRAKMDRIAGGVPSEGKPISDFNLDPDLYVGSDRPKAKRIKDDYARTVLDWNRAKEVLERARKDAGKASRSLENLSLSSGLSGLADARDDLDGSIAELSSLREMPRPAAEAFVGATNRFAHAQAKAYAMLSNTESKNEAVKTVLSDAGKIEKVANDAAQSAAEAVIRTKTLRDEVKALQLDRTGKKMKELRDRMVVAAESTRKAQETVETAMRTADAERDRSVKAARESTSRAVAAIRALDKKYGPLLTRAMVDEGLAAADVLENAVREEASDWKAKTDRARALSLQAKRSCDEADRIARGFVQEPKPGDAPFDGARAMELAGELKTLSDELAKATESLSVTEVKSRLSGIVSKAEAALTSLKAEEPDIPELLRAVKAKVQKARSELKRTNDERDALRNLLSEGSGNAKKDLESDLAKCSPPATLVKEMERLDAAAAVDGNAVAELRKRIDSVVKSVRDYSGAVDQVKRSIDAAERDRRFVRLAWEEGAAGREAGIDVKSWHISRGPDLVPRSSESSRRYGWSFAIDIPKDGNHTIEITVEKTTSKPVNGSIPEKEYFKQEGKRVKGGWINVKCSLAADSKTYADDLWIPNFQESKRQPVLEVHGPLSARRQEFSLNLELDANPAESRFQGWHADRLQFHVFLDGAEITQFWHRKQ